MDLSQVENLQANAQAMVRAAKYMGKAADELKPVVVPAACSAVKRIPGLALGTINRVKNVTPESVRKNALAVGIVGGVVAAGLVTATVAHFVHRGKVNRAYKMERKRGIAAQERQSIIEDTLSRATFCCSAKDFEARYGEQGTSDFDAIQSSGCYAILTFDPAPADDDFSSYRDVFVGASSNMADGVHKQLSGEGNLYVKADVTYDQPTYVLFFPCEGYQLYASKERLTAALGAAESYNKIDELASID